MPDDRYYEDEQADERLDGEEEPQEGYEEDYGEQEEEAGEDTELDRLLDFLVETITTARPVPLNSSMRMVNMQMVLDIVEDIRNCLPDEIRYGAEIIKKRDRIIRDAQTAATSKTQAAEARANAAIDDANNRAQKLVGDAEDHANDIIEKAEARARAMIDQSEIIRKAHEEADQICEEAKADASDAKLRATRYAEALLKGLEQDMQSTLNALHESLERVSAGL